MSIKPPTLYEISKMKEDWGLIGEEDTHLVVFLSFFGGGFVLMTGLSSGGKDAVVNAAEYCVPESWVYQIPTSLSKTALYEDADTINARPVHRHKDISAIKGKDFLEDIWKAHGEGKSITHSWTEVVPERHQESRTLMPPNCMVLFLAEDNDNVDLNDYAEVRNRALVISIDDSQSTTERVNSRQARERSRRVDYNLTEERTEEIRSYVNTIPMHLYENGGSGTYINVPAEALDNQNPLPQHYPEARRDFPRLLDFTETVCLFHYENRMEVRKNQFENTRGLGPTNLVVTPADLWLAMRIFGEKMVMSALNLREKDFEMLDILRSNGGRQMTAAEIQQEMRSEGYNITSHDVAGSMDSMFRKGYITKDQNATPVVYGASGFATKATRDISMDWPTVVDDTREIAYDTLPADIAEEYDDRFLSGEGLLVTHPFTGETINLLEEEANELENKVKTQEQKEEKAFDTSMYDSGEDDRDDGQGTLV